jgi:5-(carboxyamino)imidazole ribonucleotide mutase
MPKDKIIVLMGSKSDHKFASRIGDFLRDEGFPVECEYNVASAHRTPNKLLNDLQEYENSGDNIVLITVAGLSDALSGVVAGYTKYPAIACPPDSEKYEGVKIFSSVAMPKGIPVAYIPKPENAALASVKILALSNHSLYDSFRRYKQKTERNVYESAEEVKKISKSKGKRLK